MYIYMDGWMDGWMITVDSLPIGVLDPGTLPDNQGGHGVAYKHVPVPTRMHYK